MRNNAAQLLESIQVFDKYKAYRVGAESLVFVVDMSLEELNPALDDLMNFLRSSNFLLDYSVAISRLNKKNYTDICRRKNVHHTVIGIQHQAVYESLFNQLNLGISSLRQAQTRFRNRYIYETMKRDLDLMKAKQATEAKKIEKPITTTNKGDIDQVANDLAAKIKSIKPVVSTRQGSPCVLTPIVIHDAPKLAVGRYISCGEDPFLTNPMTEESSLSKYSPSFLSEHDLSANCIRLAEEQFLSDADLSRKSSK
jgi:hypothetical protein